MKTEADGRMFPVTDSSGDHRRLPGSAARSSGVEIRTRCAVERIEPAGPVPVLRSALTGGEELAWRPGPAGHRRKDLPASFHDTDGYALARRPRPHLPSRCPRCLPSVSMIPCWTGWPGFRFPDSQRRWPPSRGGDRALRQSGPLLVTHRGLSGPAVLKLSAWGARRLHDLSYRFALAVNWFRAGRSARTSRTDCRTGPATAASSRSPPAAPVNCPAGCGPPWSATPGLLPRHQWGDLDREDAPAVALAALMDTGLPVTGKDTFKEEFVTCGGVSLKEIDFRTMASRFCPACFWRASCWTSTVSPAASISSPAGPPGIWPAAGWPTIRLTKFSRGFRWHQNRRAEDPVPVHRKFLPQPDGRRLGQEPPGRKASKPGRPAWKPTA